MKVYVAGKNLERAGSVIDLARSAGHEITYGWVARIDDRSDLILKAYDEREAVRACDTLVYLWEDDQESARYEAGMAMGLGKNVVVSGKENAHFFSLPEIIAVRTDEEILGALGSIVA